MKTWENSKQWPFSCFSPLKGQPCIPGKETDLNSVQPPVYGDNSTNGMPSVVYIVFGMVQMRCMRMYAMRMYAYVCDAYVCVCMRCVCMRMYAYAMRMYAM